MGLSGQITDSAFGFSNRPKCKKQSAKISVLFIFVKGHGQIYGYLFRIAI